MATHGITPDISKAFVRVWHAFLFHKRKFYGISDEIFALISSFLYNRWLRVVRVENFSQEYSVKGAMKFYFIALFACGHYIVWYGFM